MEGAARNRGGNVADEMDQEAELRGLREKSGEVGTEVSETSDWSISVKRS